MHGGGHADSAHDERDHAHQAEEAGGEIEGARDVGVHVAIVLHLVVREDFAEFVAHLGYGHGTCFEQKPLRSAATQLDQVGPLQSFARDQYARAYGGAAHQAIRLGDDDAGDFEFGSAYPECLVHVELQANTQVVGNECAVGV